MKLVFEFATSPLTATIVAIAAITAIAAIEINKDKEETGDLIKRTPIAIVAITSLAFAAIIALTSSKPK